MANINETISEVQKLNPELARQITKYVKDHSYGLVFEENLPEAVRLYTKTPAVNDMVNIRPPRFKEEKEENRVAWLVKSITNNVATIERDEETKKVPIDDLVTVVDYKAVIYPGLKEVDRIERGNPDDPFSMVINAENYHALETLVYAYAGKVDCIYIDPPYNKEDSKDWKYNCNYIESTDKYRHSKWLSFIKRRLQLADKLLNKDNSVLIVTIDEVEYLRLGLLLEQMFPDAKIQMISSVINPSGVARGEEFYRTDEYIYVVRFGKSSPSRLQLSNEWITSKSTGKDKVRWRPIRRQGSHDTRSDAVNQFYPIFLNPEGTRIIGAGESLSPTESANDFVCPSDCMAIFPIRTDGTDGCWQISQTTLKSLMEKGFVKVSYTKKWGYVPQYLAEGEREKIEKGQFSILGYDENGSALIEGADEEGVPFIPGTQWRIQSHSARDYGSTLLKKFISSRKFPFPKSIYAVRDILRFFLTDNPNALVIDFFAGSGTTLHAINLLNAEDGGKRRCICVTNNEVSAKERTAYTKKGMRQGDSEWEKYGIANYITWPRTKSSIEGLDVNGKPIKGNYGFEIEEFEEIDGTVIDNETGKKTKGKSYKKVDAYLYPELAHINMSDGFKANAIFCELTYEDAWNIRLDKAFNAIAPILWMLAGCQGEIIRNIGKTYLTTDYYGVLFDYSQASKFCEKVKTTPSIKTVFVVTDDQRRYSNMCKRLPNVEVHRLYESFLKTFEICGEGGLD